ncbi:hypothetical protein [Ruminococcus sp. JE7B6]|uniref:hypothetical protein n=1 Tax=Ruminococcus sp. JE7B6 TaxID=3233380 RepID=UPI00389B2339
MKRCVIVGGADINNYEYIKSCLRNGDFIVFCDSGLNHLESLQVNPRLIVGDFDSHDNPHLGVETIVLPCEKDDTDTVFAVKEAIKRGFDDFLLIGVVGASRQKERLLSRLLKKELKQSQNLRRCNQR